MLNTIAAYECDIELQLDFLESFIAQTPLSIYSQKKSVFCGSGDSLSAAILAESFSNFTVRSSDPLDLIKKQDL